MAAQAGEAVRILLIDDDEDDFELTRGIARQMRAFRSEFRWEKGFDSGLAALRQDQPDVCLLDYRLGAQSGLELLASAREGGCTVPIIFLTGQGEQDTDDLAMRCGADDYLAKAHITPAILERSIRYAIERTRQTAQLRRSEQRYRRIVETTNEGIWLIGADAKTSFVNGRMARLLGREPGEVTGRSPLEFLGDETREVFRQTFEKLEIGEPSQVETSFVRPDGTVVWTLLEANPIFDEQGRFEGALAMVMDITARKRAEASLRVSESRFRALWDSGLMFVGVFDLAGKICEINDAGCRMLGYAREEFIAGGVRWSEIAIESALQTKGQALAKLTSTGVAPATERELIRKDGSRVPILAAAAMLDGMQGIAIALDLTGRKLAEAALQNSQEQLRQAQKMEAVGRLAGGVAHDFNNILTVILTLADLAIADLKPGEPLRDDIIEIRKAGERAADLTRQLLMFSRRQVLESRVLSLDDVLANMDKMLQRLVGEDIELDVKTLKARGRVRADPSSIEQIVMNLVVNARDAMPCGGKLTIETADIVLDEEYAQAHHGVTAGAHVMLAVTDSGTGMDKATQAQIFEPFFTTKELGKGTGLGLSTVFGIVQQSGGSVWVYSEPGHGSTFKVYLPRVDAALDVAPLRVGPALLRGTETVLLVEDDDAVRLAARSILRRQGYDVIEASNAGEALLFCERHEGPIDLLLSDVVMPQMSGPELIKRLVATRPSMKVLCMSGYTDDSVVRHGVLDGIFPFIQKPLTSETLTRKVREVLDGKRAEPTSPPTAIGEPLVA